MRQKSKTSVVFTGDICFDRYMDRKRQDENLLSKPVLDFLHNADHICANVEGAGYIAPPDKNHSAYFYTMNPKAGQGQKLYFTAIVKGRKHYENHSGRTIKNHL